jgi:hypothetical protein
MNQQNEQQRTGQSSETRSKDQVRDAPGYDAIRDQDEARRSELGTYYGPFWWP